jgi:hypothetical protein
MDTERCLRRVTLGCHGEDIIVCFLIWVIVGFLLSCLRRVTEVTIICVLISIDIPEE